MLRFNGLHFRLKESTMKIHELGHVVLHVSDLAKSVHFYGDVLGFRPVRTGDRSVMFSSGRTHHELLLVQANPDAAPLPSHKSLGMSHFALKVGDSDDELRAALAELKAEHVHIDRISDHGQSHSIYLRDPDGNQVEVYIDVQPARWKEDPSLVGQGGDKNWTL
jgi:catechol 2,3-dioxygenase